METKNIKRSRKIENQLDSLSNEGYNVEALEVNKKLNVYYFDISCIFKILNKAKSAFYAESDAGWFIFIDRDEKDIVNELKRINKDFIFENTQDGAEFHIQALQELGYNVEIDTSKNK